MRFETTDGLYAVLADDFCAGFVVEAGEVTLCAPIIRARWDKLYIWLGNGQVRWLGPEPERCVCDLTKGPDIGCLEHGPRCERHGPHPMTVDCVDCLYPDEESS